MEFLESPMRRRNHNKNQGKVTKAMPWKQNHGQRVEVKSDNLNPPIAYSFLNGVAPSRRNEGCLAPIAIKDGDPQKSTFRSTPIPMGQRVVSSVKSSEDYLATAFGFNENTMSEIMENLSVKMELEGKDQIRSLLQDNRSAFQFILELSERVKEYFRPNRLQLQPSHECDHAILTVFVSDQDVDGFFEKIKSFKQLQWVSENYSQQIFVILDYRFV